MPLREQSYEAVKNAFLALERSAQRTVELGKLCQTIMLQERARMGLPIETGADAVDLLGEMIHHSTRGFTATTRAHPHLRKLMSDIGMDVGTSESEDNARRELLQLVPPVAA